MTKPSEVRPYSVMMLRQALDRRGVSYEIEGPNTAAIGIAPLDDCRPGDLVWSQSLALDLAMIPAAIIILPREGVTHWPENRDKTLIFVDSPRDAFRMLLTDVFSDRVDAAKGFSDHSIFITPDRGYGARIATNVQLGEGVVLHPNVVIYPNTKIGNNVEIGAGVIIGAPGYSYVRQSDGQLKHFPHIGGVVIGDDVTIGANSCIDSGGLGPTRIGRGAKIGNLCQIAHNVEIGVDCLLAGRVQVGGGTKVGDRTEIWPSAVISHKLNIGSECDIKIGSVVVQNLSDGAVVSGNFAIPHEKALRDFAKKRRI